MIEITFASRWDRQPCMFGEYGQVLFWTKNYEAAPIAQQVYALMMGWA